MGIVMSEDQIGERAVCIRAGWMRTLVVVRIERAVGGAVDGPLSPSQARRLAADLVRMADRVERESDEQVFS